MSWPTPPRWLLVAALAAAPAHATDLSDAPKSEDAPGAESVRPEDRLPDHPDVEKGKAAYNAGRYNEAARLFLSLAQRFPRQPALYRALARSRTWAGDIDGAVLAYRAYLAQAPQAADLEKVQAELELALRKTAKPPEAPPGGDTLDLAITYARSGVFAGENGAFGRLDAAVEAGYIGPRLADVRDTIAEALATQSRDALERWWRPDAQASAETLSRLASGWQAQRSRRAPTAAEQRLATGLAGLSQIAAGQWAEAAQTLQPAAPGDHRLRFAQALAFARSGRDDDAAALLEALARHHDEPRVRLLRGLVLNRLGRGEEAITELRSALLD